jgi:hypothetical protein
MKLLARPSRAQVGEAAARAGGATPTLLSRESFAISDNVAGLATPSRRRGVRPADAALFKRPRYPAGQGGEAAAALTRCYAP